MHAPQRTRRATAGQRLVTRQQAESEYGVPSRTLYDLVTSGVLPAVRFPGSRRIWLRRQDIDALISSSLTTP